MNPGVDEQVVKVGNIKESCDLNRSLPPEQANGNKCEFNDGESVNLEIHIESLKESSINESCSTEVTEKESKGLHRLVQYGRNEVTKTSKINSIKHSKMVNIIEKEDVKNENT